MGDGETVVGVGEVPDDSTVVFRVEDDDGEVIEAILLETDDGVLAWRNYCQHMTHINLDKGSGAAMRNGEIVCTNHGAMFDAGTGECTFGPCEGAVLNPVEVAVENGDVVLVDSAYEFVGVGPVREDDGDLSSTSNIEF
jgi:nitrite reductase/ring-hydroxylating ferredoxin subunit